MEAELKADDGLSQAAPSPERITENPLPEAADSQRQEVTSLYSSPEPEPAAEIKDESGTIHVQDDTLDR